MKDIVRQIVEVGEENRMGFEEELVDFIQGKVLEVTEIVGSGVEEILKKHDLQLLGSVEDEVMKGLSDWARALVKGVQ